MAPCELEARGRKQDAVRARFICWLLMKKHYPRMIQTQAAAYFKRDRTSLVHGLETIRNDLKNEPRLRALVERVEIRIDRDAITGEMSR